MTEEAKKIIKDKYNKYLSPPLKIKEIFEDYYGEDRVDIQGILKYEDFTDYILNLPIKVSNIKNKNEGISSIIKTIEDSEDTVYFKDSELFIKTILPEYNINTNGLSLSIIVHFPKVRVTNEYNKYIDIEDLWVNVPINYNGKLVDNFKFNRSTFTMAQYNSRYIHSHAQLGNGDHFVNVCLGKGPLRDTTLSLINTYDEDTWRLFCFELDKYTQVESLAGIPYIRLETVSSSLRLESNYSTHIILRDFEPLLKDFIKYLIKKQFLEFYINSSGIALSYSENELRILLSNEFLKFINVKIAANTLEGRYKTIEDFIDNGILKELVYKNGYYYKLGKLSSTRFNKDKVLFTFKGNPIKLKIINTDIDIENQSKILLFDLTIISTINSVILKILNYNYGKYTNQYTTTDTTKYYL